MTTHTEQTQVWLDHQSIAGVEAGLRQGHAQLYHSDDRLGSMPVGHIINLARSCAILSTLAGVEFNSCLDVGSGSGRLGHLIEQLYGAHVVGVDLGREIAVEARRSFGLPVYVANAAALPFADEQFDLVLCSEVIEHVEHPIAVLAELWRVARRAVVLTTQEVCRRAWQRRLQMAAVERVAPHAERNYFVADDFRRAFGPEAEIQALLHLPERIRLFPRATVSDLARCLRALTVDRQIGPGSFGVLAIARKQRSMTTPRVEPEAVLKAVIDADRQLDALAVRRAADPFATQPVAAAVPLLADPAPICPECHGSLRIGDGPTVRCAKCKTIFGAPQGVPRLLGSRTAVARSEQAWLERTELQPLRRALQQRPIPLRIARKALRFAIRLVDFLSSPLPVRDKVRLAWRFLHPMAADSMMRFARRLREAVRI